MDPAPGKTESFPITVGWAVSMVVLTNATEQSPPRGIRLRGFTRVVGATKQMRPRQGFFGLVRAAGWGIEVNVILITVVFIPLVP